MTDKELALFNHYKAFFNIAGDLLQWDLPAEKKVKDIQYIWDKRAREIKEVQANDRV